MIDKEGNAIPITTRKKRYSCLAIIPCAVPIAIVAPFQLQPEKKDTVVCPLLRHSNYNRKKRYSRLAIICCAVSIAIVATFRLRPEKKDTVICPLLRHSKYDQKKKKRGKNY
jgi:hypothetical protein